MDKRKYFQNRVKKYKGQLVLDLFEVVRLLDFAEDESDYYYVVYNLKTGKEWCSFVGDFIPLKGYIPEKKYYRLLRIFKLNENLREETRKAVEEKNAM